MPVVQVSADPTVTALYGDDIDLALTGVVDDWAEQLAGLLARGGARRPQFPGVLQQRNVDFQLTRGLLGVST